MPYIAVARYIARYLGLAVMESHLKQQPYFVGNSLTTADIALYGYTHVAEEGGFDLTEYPAVREWLGRIGSRPGYVGMA